MNEQENEKDTPSGTAISQVRPWQTLASLGVTESDLTAVNPPSHIDDYSVS